MLLAVLKSPGNLLIGLNTLLTGFLALKVELEHSAEEEPGRPDPLWTLVVIAAFGGQEIVIVNGVEIVGPVISVIRATQDY